MRKIIYDVQPEWHYRRLCHNRGLQSHQKLSVTGEYRIGQGDLGLERRIGSHPKLSVMGRYQLRQSRLYNPDDEWTLDASRSMISFNLFGMILDTDMVKPQMVINERLCFNMSIILIVLVGELVVQRHRNLF